MSTEERTDLADDIAAAYDEHSEDEVVEIETDDVVEDEDVEEDVSDDVEEAEVEQVDEEEKNEEEEAPEEEDEKREDHQEEEVEDDVEPLAHWKMDDKEYFKTLPTKAKNFLIERDKEFQRHATEKANQVMHITRALDPIREEMETHGVLPEQAVATLVGAHKNLQKHPKEAIEYLMGQYHVTPEMLFAEDDSQDVVNPRIVELENKVTAQEQAGIREQQAALAARLDEFQKNAEFFEEVTPEMTELAAAERIKNPNVIPDIQVLYDKACRLNDDVWEKLQARNHAKANKAQSIDRSKNAASAKVKTSAASKKVKKDTTPKSLHDDIASSFDEVENRKHGTAL